jgi:elongation factor 1-gamma
LLTAFFSFFRYKAKYEGVDLKVSQVNPYEKDAGYEPYVAKLPYAQGKIPALEGPGVTVTECVAICHVSHTGRFENRI